MQNIHRGLKFKLLKHTACPKAVDRSIQGLYDAVEFHQGVMESIFGQVEKGVQMEEISSRNFPKLREKELRDALLEAIEVLEESRKAFKSKQLEMLRKKLTKVLIGFDR